MHQVSVHPAAGAPSRANDNRKNVSFMLLVQLFNQKLGLKESAEDSFLPMQVTKLLGDISKVALDNQKQNLDLKQHFSYPTSSLD